MGIGAGTHSLQAGGDDLAIVGGEVGVVAKLMDEVAAFDICPLLGGEHIRHDLDRAQKADLLAGQDHRLLQGAKGLEAAGHALTGRKSQSVIFLGKVMQLGQLPTEGLVLAAANVLS